MYYTTFYLLSTYCLLTVYFCSLQILVTDFSNNSFLGFVFCSCIPICPYSSEMWEPMKCATRATNTAQTSGNQYAARRCSMITHLTRNSLSRVQGHWGEAIFDFYNTFRDAVFIFSIRVFNLHYSRLSIIQDAALNEKIRYFVKKSLIQ